jgi:predicted dehydrogenase
MNPIRVAIIGCGRISELHHYGYVNNPDATIVAVCDPNRKKAEEKAAQWNVENTFTNYEDVLKESSIDMIELITPHHLHASMTVAACNAGKHVSVQKPMALNLPEATAMIASSVVNKVKLRVYENFVFHSPIMKAKELIDKDEIGEPQMIRLHFNTGTMDSAWKVPLKAWIWRLDQKKCGGGPLVFDHGYHLFSVAHFLMGDIERVSAWIDKTQVVPTKFVDGPATIMLKFKKERRYGTIDISHTPLMKIESEYYADDNRIEIIGNKGILIINRGTTKTLDHPALVLYKDNKTKAIDISDPDWKYSFSQCTKHFVNAIKNNTQPLLDGETGKKVLTSVLAAQISSNERREIDIAEVEHF